MNLGPVSFSQCRPAFDCAFGRYVRGLILTSCDTLSGRAQHRSIPVSNDIRTPARPATRRSTNGDPRTLNDVNARSRSANLMVAAERHSAGKAVRVLPALRFEISEASHILRMSRAQLYHRIGEGAIKIQKDGARTYITAGELERYVKSCDAREVASP